MPMHLQKIPATTQRSLITLVPNGLIRTAFPFISFDPAPSPKKPAYAESLATSTRPQPDPMFARQHLADVASSSIDTTRALCQEATQDRDVSSAAQRMTRIAAGRVEAPFVPAVPGAA